MLTVSRPAAVEVARARRVVLLVGAVVLLSVGDLLATMMCLRSMGMQEINPVAEFIIRHNSTAGLILFKFGSVMASVSLLLLIRHRRQGEIGAWIALLILTVLTGYWYVYSDQLYHSTSNGLLWDLDDHPDWHRLVDR